MDFIVCQTHRSFNNHRKTRFAEGGGKICIGSHTCIQSHSVLECWTQHNGHAFQPSINIGDNVSIGEYNHITAIGKIVVSDGVLTGRFVTITDNNHGTLSKEESSIPSGLRSLTTKGDVIVGKNVWIGDKVTILSGVSIGDNAIIAANAVVTKNVPANCVAAGVPARIIMQLTNE